MSKVLWNVFLAAFLIAFGILHAHAATVSPVWRNDTATNIISFNDTFGHQVSIGTYNASTGTWAIPAGGIAGTSGGILYFPNATTWASSAVLSANQIILGGGAGVAPSTPIGLGTTTQLLHGNASGAPAFGPIVSADLTTALASPPPMGVTAPNTGAFTGLGIIGTGLTAVTQAQRAPLFIWYDPACVVGTHVCATLPAGANAGLQVWIGPTPTATPAANSPEAALIAITNGNNRFNLFGLNIICGVAGPLEGLSADFIDTPCIGIEVDVFNSATSTPSSYAARNRFVSATTGTYNKVGIGIFNSPAVAQVTAALAIWSPGVNESGSFFEGISISRVSDVGLHFLSDPNSSVDSYNAFGVCAICDDSRSARFAYFGNFTHAGPMIDVSSGASFTGGFYRGSASSASNVLFTNLANFANTITIDSGLSATQQSNLSFNNRGTQKWILSKAATDDNLYVFNSVTANNVFEFDKTDAVLALVPFTANVAFTATTTFSAVSLVNSATAPTVASGFCTSPTIPASNGNWAFTINVGSACAASTGTLTMPTAAHGWACNADDVTTPATNSVRQTGGTTTTVVLTNYARTTGIAANFTSSDVIEVFCHAN